MGSTSPFPPRVWIFLSFLGVAALQAWPLPLHLGSALTGEPGGDTGVYVWNIWVFRHELLQHLVLPFTTSTILPLDGPTDLSLHNYTVFADLLSLPVQRWLGVVATFNLLYLVNVALAGFGMFLLVDDARGGSRAGRAEAWLAGLLFACSPFLVARSTAHFSLAAAAPLPFFVWALERTWHTRRLRDGGLVGACVAWAAYSDPYYGIYCVLLGVAFSLAQLVRLESTSAGAHRQRLRRGLDVCAAVLSCAVLAAHLQHGALRVGPWSVSMRSVYTPMLVITLLLTARVLLTRDWQLGWQPAAPTEVRRLLLPGAMAVVVATVLLSPELFALASRAVQGQFVAAPVFWRSSAPGVDLMALVLPNPNHPLAPHALVDWFVRQPARYEENVASIPWVALAAVLGASRYGRVRLNRLWAAIAVFFAFLALGPFIRIATVQTYIPTPWALLRYVPLIGEARMPPRFAVLVVMAVAVLFAEALTGLRKRYPSRRRTLLGVIGIALAFELMPAPRRLYSAKVPDVYYQIAADARDVRVLDLPFGIRDGLSSLGDFTAASQYYQTVHHKPLLGGYLSRVSDLTKTYYRSLPTASALLDLSEGRSLTAEEEASARAHAREFVTEAQLGYVVIETGRVKPALRLFAIDVLGLEPIVATDGFELLKPRVDQ
ncbi:MAG: hypothetical protein ABI051_09535 [Vicinamibacterales bacterium]